MNAKKAAAEMQGQMTTTALHQAEPGEHIGALVTLGRVWPSNKTQAKRVAKQGYLDVLYNEDVSSLIEPLLNKHGLVGEYKLTKSGRFIRLVNFLDLKKAFKLEYNF